MAITAAMVKELRVRTGAGMMECKKALTEVDGDIDSAAELMRKSGLAKADKKSSRTAAEGVVCIELSDDAKQAAIVEVNCETDFVSRGDDFQGFAKAITKTALNNQISDIDALLAATIDGGDKSVKDTTVAKVAKIGENIQVRRVAYLTTDGAFSSYLHGVRIGVVVDLMGGNDTLGKDIAMHIAASRPQCVAEADVDTAIVEKEKEIFAAQAEQSGKPAEIIEKMVEGRVKKFLKEVTLLGQPFVKDPDQSIEKLLKASNASVLQFKCFEVGEGIEKKTENFADEVMAQVKGA